MTRTTANQWATGTKEWQMYEDQQSLHQRAKPTIPGVDGQVVLAASEMTPEQKAAPEWLWHEDQRNVTSYGRWLRDPSQAPYIRADLVVAMLNAHGQCAGQWQVRFTDEENPTPFVCTEGDIVCVPDSNHTQPDGFDYDNFALIATTPDMFRLLVESQDNIGGDWRQRRDAVIRRARWLKNV